MRSIIITLRTHVGHCGMKHPFKPDLEAAFWKNKFEFKRYRKALIKFKEEIVTFLLFIAPDMRMETLRCTSDQKSQLLTHWLESLGAHNSAVHPSCPAVPFATIRLGTARRCSLESTIGNCSKSLTGGQPSKNYATPSTLRLKIVWILNIQYMREIDVNNCHWRTRRVQF